MTAEFSFLEMMVGMVIWTILDKSDRTTGMTLTSLLSCKRLCQAAETVVAEKMKDVTGAVGQFAEIVKRVRQLEEERNRLVHSLWVAIPDDPSGLLSRFKVTGRGKVDLHIAVPPADVDRVAEEMMNTSVEIAAFLTRYGLYPPR